MSSIQQLFELIGELARKRHQLAEQTYSELGFNHTEARLLALLHEQGGKSTQEALSGMIHVDRSNVGRAIGRLEQNGYLARAKVEGDKRANQIAVTGKGKRAIENIQRLRSQMAASFFGNMAEEEAQTLVNSLQRALRSSSATGSRGQL